MESYQEVGRPDGTVDPSTIKRISDSAFIPRDPANADYQDFLEWEAAGGVITPYVPPPVPPPPEEYLSRNRIINGDARIDLANQGAAVGVNLSTAVDSIDMFKGLGMATVGDFTLQRMNLTPPPGFTHYLKAAVIIANASLGAADRYAVRTVVEGINLVDFKLGSVEAAPMALSFRVRSTLPGIYSGSLMTASGDLSYVFEYTINAASTWEKKSILIPAAVTGTWPTGSVAAMLVHFVLAAGSNFLGAPGVWTPSALYGSTRQVNWISSGSGRTWDLTGLQLEPGPAATSFKYRPLSTEQNLCARYLQVLGGTPDASLAMLQNISTSVAIGPYRFPIALRSAPTATIKNQTHFILTNRNNGPETLQGLAIDALTPSGCRMVANVSGGQSAGFATSLMCGNFADASILFDARI